MADTKDGNIFGIKPVIGSKEDNITGRTTMSLIKKLVNRTGLGSYEETSFDSGFELYKDEMAPQIYELEKHCHNREYWFGDAASAVDEVHEADEMDGSISAFALTSGNSDFGSWTCVLGSNDTPVYTGMTKFDAHRFMVTTNNFAGAYVFQVIAGEEYEIPMKLAKKEYSIIPYVSATTANNANINFAMMPRIASGTKLWVRVACIGQNAKTISFYFGIHEYVY